MVEISDEVSNVDVCLVFNPGGHHQSMQFLEDAYSHVDYAHLTLEAVTTRNLPRTLFFSDLYYPDGISPRSVLQIGIVFVEALYVFAYLRPSVVLSTGGYLSVPALIAAWLLGRRIIFIENISRRNSQSLAGRILYWFSDRFFVQHRETKELYGKKAEYVGSIV
jgi:UDP-N-acetylglucosamine:LPS N-acetylglucosamine transferase